MSCHLTPVLDLPELANTSKALVIKGLNDINRVFLIFRFSVIFGGFIDKIRKNFIIFYAKTDFQNVTKPENHEKLYAKNR